MSRQIDKQQHRRFTNMQCLLSIELVSLILVLSLISSSHCDSFAADERLGVAYEFKVHVDSGKEDCFYQYVQPQSSLYVAFQVE